MAAYHAVVKGEHAHVSAVVDVVPSDDRVAVVLHPDAGQSVVGDLVVFVNSLNDKKKKVSFPDAIHDPDPTGAVVTCAWSVM